MLSHAVACYSVLCHALYYAVLDYAAAPCCTVLYHAVLFCNMPCDDPIWPTTLAVQQNQEYHDFMCWMTIGEPCTFNRFDKDRSGQIGAGLRARTGVAR